MNYGNFIWVQLNIKCYNYDLLFPEKFKAKHHCHIGFSDIMGQGIFWGTLDRNLFQQVNYERELVPFSNTSILLGFQHQGSM